jgi:hypothetical protein
MGQLIAETQKNSKLLEDMCNMMNTDGSTPPMNMSADSELLLECPTDVPADQSTKGLDIISSYQQKLEKKLSRFGV